MRIHLYAMMMAAAIVTGAATQAFAQTDAVSISTDSESYSDGDTIMVSGEVASRITGTPVTVQIIAPNGNVVGLEQIEVGDDRTFSFETKPGGILWTSAGDYTIRVQYGANRTAETTFAFGGSEPGTGPIAPPSSSTMYTIDAGEGGMFDIGYSITGGSVTSMSVRSDGNFGALTVMIAPTDDGQLTITLPREVIDAKANDCSGPDRDYVVLVNRTERQFTEDVNDVSRTLTIGFSADSEEIEIIGTCAVPEFGAVAVVVLAVAVVAIVAVTARSKLSLARY